MYGRLIPVDLILKSNRVYSSRLRPSDLEFAKHPYCLLSIDFRLRQKDNLKLDSKFPTLLLHEAGESGTWNRALDYLFASAGSQWKEGSTDVLQTQGQTVGGEMSTLDWTLESNPLELSDHTPVFGIWEVKQ